MEGASTARSITQVLADSVAAISSESDTRTFVHQRRIALMLSEQTALQDRRVGGNGGGGSGGGGGMGGGVATPGQSRSLGDEDLATIPQPLPRAATVKHSKAFLALDQSLSPRVRNWVGAIFAGKGVESLEGFKLPPAPALALGIDAPIAVVDGGGGADDDDVYEVEVLMHLSARMAFLKELNLQRSRAQNVGASFSRLARVLWWLLDACAADDDVASARMTMVMAETFFHVIDAPGPASGPASGAEAAECGANATEGGADAPAPGGDDDDSGGEDGGRGSSRARRFFLQSILRGHRVWRVEGFWEEVFYASVYEAVRLSSNPQCGPDRDRGDRASPGPTASADDGGLTSEDGGSPRRGDRSPSSAAVTALPAYRPGSTDWCFAYQQTIFSNLLAVAMNMATFGMPKDRTLRTILALARANGLPAEMSAVLTSTVVEHTVAEDAIY